MDFINKTVLVTGSSSGIGTSIALKFASRGADLVIIGRNETKLKKVQSKIENMGRKVHSIVADITKDDESRKVIDETIASFGKLDVLVNNAGVAGFESILSANAIETFDGVMATNLRAAVVLTHVAANHLIKTKGNIINVSSIGSLGVLNPNNFSYCASKAGLDHFTRSTAVELSEYGIRVNTVNPGPVNTEYMENMGVSKDEQKRITLALANASMLGKLVEPEEVAELVVFLASDLAESVTGSAYVIDNGVLLNGSLGI